MRGTKRPGKRGSSRIYVADDDPDIRRLVTWVLRDDGHEVIEAADGDELLEQIGAAVLGERVSDALEADLIVTDVRMPGWTGLSILTGLRHAGWKLPVILMTAYREPGLERQARWLGATVFHKPFDLESLRQVVRDARSAAA